MIYSRIKEPPIKVIGIESSCDESGVAILSDRSILVNKLFSQEHIKWGGVVPEVASRNHLEQLPSLIKEAFLDTGLSPFDMDCIAVTKGPGLIGGLIVGVMIAKAMALVSKKPIVAVNHLEGHALTARLTDDIQFPYLLLLISGGHCQILSAIGVGQYYKYGETIDDALGESFDKVGKMLKLDYPGGPIIEELASYGDPSAIRFPRPLYKEPNSNFSFSGLKTAVWHYISKFPEVTEQHKRDICSSFQKTIGDILCDRLKFAIQEFSTQFPYSKNLVVAGGVASNKYIRKRLENFLEEYKFKLIAAPASLCTDNAAMIAWAGYERFKQGSFDSLDFEPVPRWPLCL